MLRVALLAGPCALAVEQLAAATRVGSYTTYSGSAHEWYNHSPWHCVLVIKRLTADRVYQMSSFQRHCAIVVEHLQRQCAYAIGRTTATAMVVGR